MNGFEHIDYREYFNISSTGLSLRGHEMKLYKSRFNTTIRGNSFSQRIIDNWNNLSSDVINSNSVMQFKSRLDISCEIEGLYYKCVALLPSVAV